MKYLSFAAACLLMAGCNPGKQAGNTAGIDLANLDTTALPGTDFYQFACGGWMKNHPLTGEYSRFGSFDELRENNQAQVRQLIEQLASGTHAQGSVAQKIGDLYGLAMDSVTLNEVGATPLEEETERIGNLASKKEIYPMIASLAQEGISSYFNFFVSADDKNSSMNIVHFYQGELGIGQRDYYLENDARTTAIREAYRKYIVRMFALAGFDNPSYGTKAMQSVMNIETALAKAARTQAQLRDTYANYNKKSLEEWKREIPTFEWDAFFTATGLKAVNELNIGQPEAIQEVAKLIDTLPLSDHIAYLQWNLINAAAPYLNDEMAAANFDFYGKTLSGKTQMRPRWKRAISAVQGALGEAVGQLYVEQYFPAAAKARMSQLVGNLQTALGERIQALAWMGDSTKVKAKEKLATFHVKIGYPDKWKDYTTLAVNKADSYWANLCRASKHHYDEMIAKAGKPVDKDEWFMTPQTVNAYYNPTTNEICFPAGILQPPFFDMHADDAFNYGAIGVVIGHEMTHGFDDQGRQYDPEGNLKDWWTPKDAKNFDERADKMVAFFDSIVVAPGTHANGRFTLGENIADHGGLKVAYQAYRNATAAAPLPVKEGFTPDQRFFIAYAGLWAGNIRSEEIGRLTKMDPHSLGKWRVDGALPHIDAWYEAFHIQPGDPMYLPENERVSIW
ncbi:MAG: M13 family metallopeptidase [Prevotellaceae bacterium]|jgi:putative endopeptidase|nr:M13 family metallopeptidase [Prevotellaceae bacterium]